MLLARGVALLLPNYRGSLGLGESFVRALHGQAGRLDVDDVAALTAEALRLHGGALDRARVCAFGGSHGGFLSGWLAGHPTHRALFCAAALWNPGARARPSARCASRLCALCPSPPLPSHPIPSHPIPSHPIPSPPAQ
jgi:dipeptidyl aminopeptidase/acylaminoacyl peptidase